MSKQLVSSEVRSTSRRGAIGIGVAFAVALSLVLVFVVGLSAHSQAVPLLPAPKNPTVYINADAEGADTDLTFQEQVTYTVEVRPGFNDKPDGGWLTYTLPAGLDFQDAAPADYDAPSGDSFIWNLGAFTESLFFTITARVPVTGNVLGSQYVCTATAVLTDSDGFSDPDTEVNADFALDAVPTIVQSNVTEIEMESAGRTVNDKDDQAVAGEGVTITVRFTVPQNTVVYSLTPEIVLQDGLRFDGSDPISTSVVITDKSHLPSGFDGTLVTLTPQTMTETDTAARVLTFTLYAHVTQNTFAVPGTEFEDGDELAILPTFDWSDKDGVALYTAQGAEEDPVEVIRPSVAPEILTIEYLDAAKLGSGDGEVRIKIFSENNSYQFPTPYDLQLVVKFPAILAVADVSDAPISTTIGGQHIVTWTDPISLPYRADGWTEWLTMTLPVTFEIGSAYPITALLYQETFPGDVEDEGLYPVAVSRSEADDILYPGLGDHNKTALSDLGNESVKIGDRVTFTVSFRQASGTVLNAPQYTDTMPVGFHYISGTLDLDGAAVIDVITASVTSADGKQEVLHWTMADWGLVPATHPVTATYVVVNTGKDLDGTEVYIDDRDVSGSPAAENEAGLYGVGPEGDVILFSFVANGETSTKKNNPAIGPAEVVQPYLSDLVMRRTPNTEPIVQSGDEVKWEFGFSNSGDAAAYEVEVCSVLEDGTTYFVDPGTQPKYEDVTVVESPVSVAGLVMDEPQLGDEGQVCWMFERLDPGHDYRITYYFKVHDDARAGVALCGSGMVIEYTAQPGVYPNLPPNVPLDRLYSEIDELSDGDILPPPKEADSTPTPDSQDVGECFALYGLAADKRAGKNTIKGGEKVTYTITYTNANPYSGYSGIVLTDTYDVNLEYSDASPTPDDVDETARVLVWNAGDLPNENDNGQIVLTMTAVQPLPDGVQMVHNVLEWTSAELSPTYRITETVFAGVPNLDISMSGVAEPSGSPTEAIPTEDNQIVYTIVYTNTGFGEAPVTLTLAFDGVHLTFDSARMGDADRSGSPVTPVTDTTGLLVFRDNNLELSQEGDDKPRKLEVTLNFVDQVDYALMALDAEVTIESEGAASKQDTFAMPLKRPVLMLRKSGPELPNPVGQLMQYAIRVANMGNYTATNLAFTDTWGANTSYNATNSALGWVDQGSYATSNPAHPQMQPLVQELGIGQVVTLTFFVDVDVDAPIYSNTVQLSTDQTSIQAYTEEVWQPSIITRKAWFADPAWFKQGDPAFPARTITYTVYYTNTDEDSSIQNAIVTDTLPGGFSYLSHTLRAVEGATGCQKDAWRFTPPGGGNQTAIWRCDSLNFLGDSSDPGKGYFLIWGMVTGDEDTYLTNTTKTAGNKRPERPIEEPLVTRIGRPWLTMTTSVMPLHPVAPGDIITFTLTYTNGGTDLADDVRITNALPERAVWVKCGDGDACGIDASDVITWFVDEVPRGASGSVYFVAQAADAPNQQVTNEATLFDIKSRRLATNETTARGSASVLILNPHITVKKALTPTVVTAPNDLVTYTLTFTNDGGGQLTNVVISDVLSTDSQFADASSECTHDGAPSGGTVLCDIGSLQQGEKGAVQIRVYNLASENQQVFNTAWMNSDQPGGPWTSNETAFLFNTKGCTPPLYLDFSVEPANPLAGQVVTFTGSASNDDGSFVYSWEIFGDDNPGNGKVVTHTFENPDTYLVRMTVGNGCTPDPYYDRNVEVKSAAYIAITPAELPWSIPIRPTPDAFTDTLTITNDGTDVLSWTVSITPSVAWLAIPTSTLSGQAAADGGTSEVHLAVTPTLAGGIGVTSTMMWIESNAVNQPQLQVPVTLTLEGTPVMEVTPASIEDTLTVDDSASHTLTISNTGEVTLSWTLDVPAGDTWLTVSLTSTNTGPGDATSVDVMLDATGLSEANFPYTSKLTIDGDPYGPQTVPVTLTVQSGCVSIAGLSFTFAPSRPEVGQTVNFTASVTAGTTPSYAWDFGDTGTGNGRTVTHVYSAADTYTVTVTADNACSDPVDAEDQITVSGYEVYLPLVLKQ